MATRKHTTHIVVHCAATPPSRDIGAREIDKMHRQRGFLKIGYHFVIRRNGKVETGRRIDEPGAHCKGLNGVSVGICLIGGTNEETGKPEENFTPAQWRMLEDLIHQTLATYPNAKVVGHNEFAAKACPCFNVPHWWADPSAPLVLVR